MGARAVHRSVLRKIDSDNLRVHFVWLDIIGGDSQAAAREQAEKIRDPRVTHYWIADDSLTRQFAGAVGMKEGAKAWDVFLLYDQDTTWGPNAPPQPESYMHKKPSLPEERLLDADRLADEVRELLSDSP